jgi:hypothetical protein
MDRKNHPVADVNRHLFEATLALKRAYDSSHPEDRDDLTAMAKLFEQAQRHLGAVTRRIQERGM